MPNANNETGDRTITFSDRVACPVHGRTMVLIHHQLGAVGRAALGKAVVTFFRCIATVTAKNGEHVQCGYCRPNKYQQRFKGERRK